ncbi:MAG: hypothetical protein VYE26_02870 [Pseudomonadota bacterium]|nr:hypothetical protein [Pseudomonadota bacterium]
MPNLTKDQDREVASQFVEIIVDGMDIKTLVQIVTDQLTDYYENCSSNEIKEEIDNYDPELYEELVDNVTQQYPKQRPQYYE